MTVLGERLQRDEETGEYTSTGEYVSLGQTARSRGIYTIGTTGTGKTTFLQSVAYQDMKAGDGLCVLDPHGDMIDFLLTHVPEERENDVIVFNPSDVERPFGLNLLACDQDDWVQVRWVISTITTTLQRLYADSWGPRLQYVLGHTLWTAMTIPGATLVEVLLLLTDPIYRATHTNQLTEPLLRNFWDSFPTSDRERDELTSSTVNKLTPFLLDRGMRNIIGQTQNTLDFRKLMDSRKIVLVNLSKGELGENNSSLLGSVIINLILIAALSRRDMPVTTRRTLPFHVLVDEYQNFASESFSVLQSEARKYAVDLVVAHQYRDQLDILNRGSALNVGNFVCFRVTGIDSTELAMQFDNTPPAPDMRYEPVRKQSAQVPGVFYQDSRAEVQVPQPRRMYTDVAAERANTLANLPPFHALLKLIDEEQRDGTTHLRLSEYAIKALDPAELTNEPYFGIADEERADRIWERSRMLASEQAVVEKEFKRRTDGRAQFTVPPASGEEE